MSRTPGPRRRTVIALLAAVLLSGLSLVTDAAPSSALRLLPLDVTSVPGDPLTLVAGATWLATGRVVADLPNGANGPISLTIGPCLPLGGASCSGVLSQFSLIGNFKDEEGNPLYADDAPASVSWTCNSLVCPPPADFAPGSTTVSQLQVKEFRRHPVYVALRNPDGTFQPYAAAPACHGTGSAPLPVGTIDRQATGGREFCVDVGAISRGVQACATACTAWAGPLTLPVLFVEDPKFMPTTSPDTGGDGSP